MFLCVIKSYALNNPVQSNLILFVYTTTNNIKLDYKIYINQKICVIIKSINSNFVGGVMFNFFNNNIEKYYKNLIKENKSDKQLLYGINPKYKNQESNLLKMFGKCDIFNKKIKMIIISDTHGCLIEEEFAKFMQKYNKFDVCLLLGDHSVRDVEIIIKYVDDKKIYALLGNHDNNYIEKFNLKNLNGKVIDINGVKLLGIQGSYRYKPDNFPSFTQKESIEFLNNKEKVDILLCHDAPYGLSERNDVAHQGLFGILYYLFKNKVPYCIHGHLHTQYNKQMINGTKVNCYYMYNYIELTD